MEDGRQSLRCCCGLRLLLAGQPLLQLVIHLGRLVRMRVRVKVRVRVRARARARARAGVRVRVIGL